MNHQGLLSNVHCVATVVLRKQLNFKSAVLRSNRSSCFLSRSVEFNSGRPRNIMGKDAKGNGNGKTRAKKVKGGKCAAEKQDVKESTDSLRNTLTGEMSSLG